MIPGLPDKLCRLCLWRSEPLTYIFGDVGRENKFPTKMKEVFPFKVEKDDGLPNYLCRNCIFQLEVLHEFVLRSVITDTTLRERYGLPNELLDSYELQDEEQEPVPCSSAQEPGNVQRRMGPFLHILCPKCLRETLSGSATVSNATVNVNGRSEEFLPQDDDSSDGSENSTSPPLGNASGRSEESLPRENINDDSSDGIENSTSPPLENASGRSEESLPRENINDDSSDGIENSTSPPLENAGGRSEESLPRENINDDSSNGIENSTSPPLGNLSDPMCSKSLARNLSPTPPTTNIVDRNKRKAITAKKRKITCHRCSGVFSTRNEAMLHYCNSPSSSCIKCRYCGKQFNSLGALKNHKKKHTNIALFLCSHCSCTFQTWKARRIHLRKECPGRSLQSTSNAGDTDHEDLNSLSENESCTSSKEHSFSSDKHRMVRRKSCSPKHSQEEVKGTSTTISSSSSGKTKLNSAAAEEKNTPEEKMILKKSGARKHSRKEVNSTLTSSVSGALVNSGNNSAPAEDKETSKHTETDSMQSSSVGKRIRYRTYSDSIWLVG